MKIVTIILTQGTIVPEWLAGKRIMACWELSRDRGLYLLVEIPDSVPTPSVEMEIS